MRPSKSEKAFLNAPAGSLALELTDEVVRLCEREADGGWKVIGLATPSSPGFAEEVDRLRVEALVRDPDRRPLPIFLPPQQVLARRYDLSAMSERTAALHSLDRLAEETGYGQKDLCIDMAPAPRTGPRLVLAALRQTVGEALGYVTDWGFVAGPVSIRGYEEEFARAERLPDFAPKPATRVPVWHWAGAAAAACVAVIAVGAFGWSGDQPVGTDIVASAAELPERTVMFVRPVQSDMPLQRADTPLTRPYTGGLKNLAWPRLVVDPGPRVPGAAEAIVALRVDHDGRLSAQPDLGDMRLGPALHPVARLRAGRLSAPPAASGPVTIVRLDTADAPPSHPTGSPPGGVTAGAVEIKLAQARVDASPLPPSRPDAAQPVVEDTGSTTAGQAIPAEDAASTEEAEAPSPYAVAESPAPMPRPGDLAVASAASEPSTPIRVTRMSPKRVGRVAVEHGLALDETSLIGIIDANAGRQALVRLPGGSYRRLSRGDRLDGWRVSTISSESMRLTRNGQRRVLLLVSQ